MYFYDADGNLIKKTDPVGDSITEYDEAGRPDALIYSDGINTDTFNLTYWSGTDNVKTAVNINGAYDFTYNKTGWLTETTDPFGIDQSYTYKPGGQIKSFKVGDETTTTYVYQDNLMSTLQNQGLDTTFSYDARRNLIGLARPNNADGYVAYNKANHPEQIIEVLPDETMSVTYRYDKSGNTIAETLGGAANRYVYNGLDQITSWLGSDGTTDYTYDAAGNLIQKGDTTYAYDEVNRLTGDGVQTYTYNDRGDLISDGVNAYVRNAAGNLASFTSNAGTTNYTYDYQDRRLTKVSPTGYTLRYHWLGNNLVAESDSSGIIATYTYTDKGRLHSMTRGGQTYYYHLAARGDVLALTNSSGQVVARYSYDPWGATISASGPLADQPFRYAGYYFDSESQMYYLLARYYHPGISRFISPDQAPGDSKKPLSFNSYIYADNNPMRYVDSRGNTPIEPDDNELDPRENTDQARLQFWGDAVISRYLGDKGFTVSAGNTSQPTPLTGFIFTGTIFSNPRGAVGVPGSLTKTTDYHYYSAGAGRQKLAYYNSDLYWDGYYGALLVATEDGSTYFTHTGRFWLPPALPVSDKTMSNLTEPGSYYIRISAGNYRYTYGYAYHPIKYIGVIHSSSYISVEPREENSHKLGKDPTQEKGGDPVMTSTGNFFYDRQDLNLPGRGMSLNFKRSYNSLDAKSDGPLGHGWTHNYNASLLFDSPTTTTVIYGDGAQVKFGTADGVNFAPSIGVTEKLVKNPNGSYKLIFADQSIYNFNAEGRLVSQADKYGNMTTLTYTNGVLTKATDSSGRYLNISYSDSIDTINQMQPSKFIRKVTDSSGRSVSFNFNSAGNMISATDARGKTTKYRYSAPRYGYGFTAGNQLTEIIEPGAAKSILKNVYGDFDYITIPGIIASIMPVGGSGQNAIVETMSSISIPVNGKVIKQYDAHNNQWNFSYDEGNKKTTMIDNKGNTTVHEYDDDYRTIKSIDSSGHSSRLSYDFLNKPLTTVNQKEATTSYSYDTGGNITQAVDPEDHSSEASYDLANNNLLWAEDALGRRATYTYDPSGKFLDRVLTPIGTTLFDYYTDGLIKTLTDANSHTASFEYNTFGNLAKVIDATDASTTMGYDDVGRMTTATDAEGHRSEYTYDEADNILNIKDPLVALYPSQRHQVDFTYDDRGNQESFKDANNNLTRFIYDDMNSLTNVVDAFDSTTTYGFDPNYNLSSVTDAEGHITRYGYDTNDRLRSITDPTSKTVEYRYDKVGNLKTAIYPNGNKSYFGYDKDNLLKSIRYGSEDTSYSFEYDPLHQLAGVTDNLSRQWNFDYDEGNRLIKSQENVIPAQAGIQTTFTVSREYDAVSNLIGIKAGAEATTAYSYNQRDDLTAIDLPGGIVDEITFEYDKARKRTKAKTPGTISSVKYDEASRVTKFINETQSTTQTFTYDYDSNGNITTVSDNKTSGTVNDTRYAYDALNRLTDWYNPLTDTTTSYSYDKVGNLLEVKEGQTIIKSFTYNPANQISSADFSYDDNGNMTGDTDKRYVYDAENRLQQVVSKATSQTIASYEYDFMGRRTSSTDTSGSTTYFHYDGWNVMAESDSSGTITANYYYDISGQVQVMKKAGQTYYYQFNAHGDVVSLTDTSGSVVNSYTYDPWGSHLTSSETVKSPFRYAGYRFDEETGLYYLRARYYGPGIGRFLTKEPLLGELSDPPVHNAYMYARDNPVKYVDPSGLKCEKSFWQRSWDNFILTNKTIPGLILPLGSNALATKVTNGHFFKITQSPTLWQWARNGFGGARMGGSSFTALETGFTAAAATGTQFVLVGASFEVGIGIGSMISVAILPCEQPNSFTTGFK